MTDETTSSTPVSAIAKIDVDEGRFDMNAMREFSVAETDAEAVKNNDKGKSNGNEKQKSSTEKSKTEAVGDSDEDELEEGSEEGETDSESDSELLDDEDSEEDDSEEEEGSEDDDEEESSSDKKFVTAKDGDKEIKIPKDAKLRVKIDGEYEELTAQEVINRASGAINIERQSSALGRERAALDQDKKAWKEEASNYQDNLNFIQEITEKGTLEDIVEFVGTIQGKDPTALLDELMTRVADYVDKFSGMTEETKALYNENRRLKFKKELDESRSAKAQSRKQIADEVEDVTKNLGTLGLTEKDLQDELAAVLKLEKEGKLEKKDMKLMDVALRARSKMVHSTVVDAISGVSPKAAGNEVFVEEVLRAVVKAESLTGEYFSRKELQKFAKTAAVTRKQGFSERLSRKVDKARKSGKTGSKNATSRKQGKEKGPLTLNDHRQSLADGDWGFNE